MIGRDEFGTEGEGALHDVLGDFFADVGVPIAFVLDASDNYLSSEGSY